MSARKAWIFTLIILTASSAWALRINKPFQFSHPWTADQIVELNNVLDEIFEMQKGRFELDIVSTTKANPKNGEIWIFNDGGTYKLQFRANDTTSTITP